MTTDEVLRVLDALFKPGDELLRGAIVVEILKAIDVVAVLSKVKVFLGLALLAHPPAVAGIYRTHESDRLPMLTAHEVLVHLNDIISALSARAT